MACISKQTILQQANAYLRQGVFILVALLFLISVSGTVPSPVLAQGAYGPDTCVQGYVWRDAFPGDHVCVLPSTRAEVARDNSQADARRQPGGGAYGPDTCRVGFVWREANPKDHVCVSPEMRELVRRDNSVADSRFLRNNPPLASSTIRVLSTETDRCGDSSLRVVGQNGEVQVEKGTTSPQILTNSPDITWYCGGDRERTVCPNGTNAVVVYRDPEGRRFLVDCLAAGSVELETTLDRCSESVIYVFGKAQSGMPTPVKRGEEGISIKLSDRRFKWFCGEPTTEERRIFIGAECQWDYDANGVQVRECQSEDEDIAATLRAIADFFNGPQNHTTCAPNTQRVKVDFPGDDRKIVWHCMSS